jgi:predicted phosphodiesterase
MLIMRVAALYDIHGNLPALAVLDVIAQGEVDLVVVGGDVVPGPMPIESLRCLLSLPIPVQFIQGNGEAAVLDEIAGRNSSVPEQFRDVVRHSAQQIPPEYAELIVSWPKTLRLEIGGLGEVSFCHATPRSNTEVFTRSRAEDLLLPIFAEARAPVVICGHTHMQFDRMVDDVHVINAGSVGMPFGEPGAYWLLLGPDVQLRRTSYNLETAAERIRATSYPQAQEFAARNVLQPPTEREMLEVFAKVELK